MKSAERVSQSSGTFQPNIDASADKCALESGCSKRLAYASRASCDSRSCAVIIPSFRMSTVCAWSTVLPMRPTLAILLLRRSEAPTVCFVLLARGVAGAVGLSAVVGIDEETSSRNCCADGVGAPSAGTCCAGGQEAASHGPGVRPTVSNTAAVSPFSLDGGLFVRPLAVLVSDWRYCLVPLVGCAC